MKEMKMKATPPNEDIAAIRTRYHKLENVEIH
jgi:hypothetical protein